MDHLMAHHGRVARVHRLNLDLGVAFDFAFFLSVSHPEKPFNRPNSRSTLFFDRSL
jgi:hypothetical protein